jgi:hypothetical protein
MVWHREFSQLVEAARGTQPVNDAGLSYGEVYAIRDRLKDNANVEVLSESGARTRFMCSSTLK